MPSNIVNYTGTATTVIDRYDALGYPRKQWLDDDGSTYRGYELPGGQLVGACFVVSAARQAALDAANAVTDATDTQVATFKASIVTLGQLVKDNTATLAQQRLLLVKVARVSVGVLSDMP